jgi:hypothetical protein
MNINSNIINYFRFRKHPRFEKPFILGVFAIMVDKEDASAFSISTNVLVLEKPSIISTYAAGTGNNFGAGFQSLPFC